ncbi:hypothetical protein B0T16DRAFT_138743 [Cercophora newfieldiana]|uniref:Uncharacterized protein n=1 Tax=Cercophora newfieldiana TaxID=92897 RepID=A0AA39YC74_9PEZI|nr:hypothetical protein B0T16DRAFT_138743 [Cercophora newfieldiana]
MGDINIFISNGTCYSAAGERLDGSFIPCGNVAAGHQTCCGAGDNCLADNSCWGVHGSGYGSSLTYQAGCTDPTYEDSSCPKKAFDQPWIALTHCDGSNGAWAPCSQPGNPSTLQPGTFCSCTDAAKTTLAFRDTETLTSIASLPRSTGQSINYFITPERPTNGGTGGSSPTTGGNSPTGSAPGSSASSSGSSGGSGTSSTARETGTSSPNNDPAGPSSGMSSGTKIAIGVGVTVGVLILLAAIVALFLLRRRQRAKSVHEVENSSANGNAASKNRVSAASSSLPPMSEADGQPVSEADGKAARPWSMRSELEGTQVGKNGHAGGSALEKESGGQATKPLSPVAELPGNDSWYQEGRGRQP